MKQQPKWQKARKLGSHEEKKRHNYIFHNLPTSIPRLVYLTGSWLNPEGDWAISNQIQSHAFFSWFFSRRVSPSISRYTLRSYRPGLFYPNHPRPLEIVKKVSIWWPWYPNPRRSASSSIYGKQSPHHQERWQNLWPFVPNLQLHKTWWRNQVSNTSVNNNGPFHAMH